MLHHAILNLTEPRFEQALVDSVFACRPGKGLHAALPAVQRGLRRMPWVVQVDVDGYIPSIDHGLLMQLLRRRFKGEAFLGLLRPSDQGLRFCGYRVRAGVLLPGRRKLARYRAAVLRLQGAERAGVPQALLQRAHDGQVATLLPAQSLRFRHGLWAGDL